MVIDGKQEGEFWSNLALRQLHEIAIEDYITGRSAVLHLGLSKTGLALAAQAVEKLCKCYLILAGKEARSHGHEVDKLLAAVISLGHDHLKRHTAHCDRLKRWYAARYHDSVNKANSWGVADVAPLDELVYELEEGMPLPESVAHLKYGGGPSGMLWDSIFVRMFEATSQQHWHALLDRNEPLTRNSAALNERFLANRSKVMPAETPAEMAISRQKMQEELAKIFPDVVRSTASQEPE